MTDIRYGGGCACGALRYEVRAAPRLSLHCQCRQCQRATGSGHASLLVLSKAVVTLSGELRYYDQLADDGSTVSRGFCPHCGSPVAGRSSGYPELIMLTAASLDDPTRFEPQQVVWSASAQPWDFLDPALPRA